MFRGSVSCDEAPKDVGGMLDVRFQDIAGGRLQPPSRYRLGLVRKGHRGLFLKGYGLVSEKMCISSGGLRKQVSYQCSTRSCRHPWRLELGDGVLMLFPFELLESGEKGLKLELSTATQRVAGRGGKAAG